MIAADGAVVGADGVEYARVANPEQVPAARARIHAAHCRCRGDLAACTGRPEAIGAVEGGKAA